MGYVTFTALVHIRYQARDWKIPLQGGLLNMSKLVVAIVSIRRPTEVCAGYSRV